MFLPFQSVGASPDYHCDSHMTGNVLATSSAGSLRTCRLISSGPMNLCNFRFLRCSSFSQSLPLLSATCVVWLEHLQGRSKFLKYSVNPRCTLKQEEEKMLRLETLYEKTREELRRKEDRYCKEMEEKQQLELHSKNLEMELITLRKLLRQVEEEREETQKQLSQEKSARALQEGILNNHLWRQKELEEETRRTIEKNSEVGDLSQQLEKESKTCMQLKAQNSSLREELSTMRESHEQLEKSECQLKEEVAKLKHHLETSMVDRSLIEQYKREVEERAAQEIRQKLEEVNLFLQTQAVSQDRLEQIRASHHASLRNQLKHRIRDLECELDRIKNTQQDGIFQQESTHAEVERYKELYLEELKIRRRLGNKLERSNERLAEANAKLLQERCRNKALFTSSIVSGGLAESPVQYSTELGHLGNSLTLNRSLSLGGSFLSPTWNALSSRNRVEAYMAKVSILKQCSQLLLKNIHKQSYVF
uniref:Ankyrin repeat domain 26 n=1 Tax=Melopsittacus undulatus TaxID=13146 RepID=A0A8V5FK89_MELUD